MLNPLKDDVKAELSRSGFDDIRVTIECVGRSETVQYAIEYAGKAATAMIFGLTDPDCAIPYYPFQAFKKELTIKTSYVNPTTQGRAAAIIASGRLNLHDLISDRVALSDIGTALPCPAPATAKRSFCPESLHCLSIVFFHFGRWSVFGLSSVLCTFQGAALPYILQTFCLSTIAFFRFLW